MNRSVVPHRPFPLAYLQNERRFNYTTPKSFLEQIGLYRNLLQTKRREHEDGIVRLENGLVKLESYV